MDPPGCKPSPTPSPGRRGERLLEDQGTDPDLHVVQSAAEGGEFFLLRVINILKETISNIVGNAFRASTIKVFKMSYQKSQLSIFGRPLPPSPTRSWRQQYPVRLLEKHLLPVERSLAPDRCSSTAIGPTGEGKPT